MKKKSFVFFRNKYRKNKNIRQHKFKLNLTIINDEYSNSLIYRLDIYHFYIC